VPGRLQKVAALIAAASAFAPIASFADPNAAGGAASMGNVDIGFNRHLPLGIEARVSMFRARSETASVLPGETAITEFARPTVRQGVHANARYEPLPWLALDFHGMALQSRYADGAAESIVGAPERGASAAATLRMPAGWSASLALNYLARRNGIEETLTLATSTFANARLARDLSKRTRVSLDFSNLLGQRLRDVDYLAASRNGGLAPTQDSLFNPAEPRGVRLWLKTTF
jgi:hypothetical protein